MAVLKCKMCGGDIELAADKTFGTCEFCGNTMTLPKVSDEQRAAAFNRGNHFRRTGEFDKALAVYERIVQEDDTDAEAHWCCALCRFGIEYVEDPATYEWLPTCHRASFDSFLEDVDYLAAVEHSEGVTRRQYQREAMKIAEVQRGILATSQNTEPYDVFICYKESDATGSRTRDSMLAQDVYYQLTDQGLRVFFARITLEDVAGTQYEPYIFAALNSAKVMVVITTSAENVNAVWVKNEWSRFLALMRKDRSKLLLPCYRDMDPYDLPEALSVLQSYDMSKIGFIQDLVRGIKKVLSADKPAKPAVRETVAAPAPAAAPASNIAPLLERAFIFLEDRQWADADSYCEKVLDIDPKCAEAYLGKLMAELKVRTRDGLKDAAEPFDDRGNYTKAARFGDEALKAKLAADNEYIKTKKEDERLAAVYAQAKDEMQKASSEEAYNKAAELFGSISKYKDSEELKRRCISFAGQHKEKREAAMQKSNRRRKRKRTVFALIGLLVVVILACVLIPNVVIPLYKLNNADTLFEQAQYEEAFAEVTTVEESGWLTEKAKEKRLKLAAQLVELGKYKEAIAQFNLLGEYSNAQELRKETVCLLAWKYAEGNFYTDALEVLEGLKSEGYEPAAEHIHDITMMYASYLIDDKLYSSALIVLDEWAEENTATPEYNRLYTRARDALYKQLVQRYRTLAAQDENVTNNNAAGYSATLSIRQKWYGLRTEFEQVSGYIDADKYITLIDMRLGFGGIVAADFKDLVNYHIDFEDTKDVIALCYMKEFMLGEWRSTDGYYFKRWEDSNGYHVDMNIPLSRHTNYLAFVGYGAVIFYNSSENPHEQTAEWQIEIVSKDKIQIYSTYTDKTYVLTRQ